MGCTVLSQPVCLSVQCSAGQFDEEVGDGNQSEIQYCRNRAKKKAGRGINLQTECQLIEHDNQQPRCTALPEQSPSVCYTDTAQNKL